MHADDFAAEVSRIAAEGASEWRSQGLAESSIALLLLEYRLVRERWVESLVDDPLLDLIYCFDTTNFHVGHIGFDETLRDCGGFLRFGTFDVDIIGISKHDGSIAVYEYSHLDHVMCTCASDRATFLDALLGYLRLPYGELTNDERYRCADELAAIAGGDHHVNFWRIMLCCDC